MSLSRTNFRYGFVLFTSIIAPAANNIPIPTLLAIAGLLTLLGFNIYTLL